MGATLVVSRTLMMVELRLVDMNGQSDCGIRNSVSRPQATWLEPARGVCNRCLKIRTACGRSTFKTLVIYNPWCNTKKKRRLQVSKPFSSGRCETVPYTSTSKSVSTRRFGHISLHTMNVISRLVSKLQSDIRSHIHIARA